jgi:hypothetical protein
MVENRDLGPPEQPSLLSPEELTELQCPVSRSRKGEVASRKVRRLQEVEERFIQRAGATQLKLPGI